jgi:2-polyprenyl-3-methyl-5-hydroxy-6-metoxy-1,4-benzoquinol methylase
MSPDVETSSEGYARRFSGEIGRFFLDVQNATVLDLLAPWPGAKVLDVGGGHAQLAPALVERGFRVTVAGSEEVCRERLDRVLPPGSFEFRACDLLALPYPDRAFDVVVSLRLLAHVERWRELVAELCRVASRAVIVDYSDSRSFNQLYGPLFSWKKAVEGNTRTYQIFKPGEVAAEAARHGFGRPAERRQFFLPMVVHRAMKSSRFSRMSERVGSAVGLTRWMGSPVVLGIQRETR